MAVRSFRYDRGSLGDQQRTPQGGFRVPALPTRVGVFQYRQTDGTVRREYRPPEEVFNPASLATLAHAPVTDLHPEREGVRVPVTPENFRELAMGHVAEDVRPEGDHVAATVLIQDQDLILKIERPADPYRECSCGYECTLDPTPGVTPQGEVFDAIQRDIRYNHLALGPRDWGRAGASVALRLDEGDQVPGKDPSVKETIDGKEYTVGTPEWAAAVRAHAAKQTAEAQGRADAAEAGRTKAVQDLATATDPKGLTAQVQARVRLVTDCARAARSKGVRFDEAKAAGTDENGLMMQAIALLDPAFDPKGPNVATPGYLIGYFQALIKGLGADEASEKAAGLDAKGTPQVASGAMNETPGAPPPGGTQKTDGIFGARAGTPPAGGSANQDQGGPDPDKARRDSQTKSRERWKAPLAASKDVK